MPKWRIESMTNDTTKFRVRDDSNPPRDVTHRFISQVMAQQYIYHYELIKSNPFP